MYSGRAICAAFALNPCSCFFNQTIHDLFADRGFCFLWIKKKICHIHTSSINFGLNIIHAINSASCKGCLRVKLSIKHKNVPVHLYDGLIYYPSWPCLMSSSSALVVHKLSCENKTPIMSYCLSIGEHFCYSYP